MVMVPQLPLRPSPLAHLTRCRTHQKRRSSLTAWRPSWATGTLTSSPGTTPWLRRTGISGAFPTWNYAYESTM
eukprot:5776972-Pyramimonas_sp.AAC.1